MKSNQGVEVTQTIPQYFSKKNIFVTGANGFMGKVLIEKLLRSCPDIETIYILIRNKKGVSGKERWNKTSNEEIFNKLKEINPLALNKIKVLEGDVKEIELGLNIVDRNELIEKVNIVYHSAATVKFNETLSDAILLNLRGTREVCNLVLEMKNLEVFMHVSTAYCQGYKNLDEKLYPARGNPYEIIELAERMDSMSLKLVTSKYCEGFANTYVFSKCLAETVVKDMCQNKVPTVVFRPTIVTSALSEPIKGYVDNFNGPMGLCYAGSKGIFRSMFTEHVYYDYCPVDSAIAFMIKATWHQSITNKSEIGVYNSSNTNLFSITSKQQTVDCMHSILEKKIWCKPILYPNVHKTTNPFIYWIYIYLLQLLPALLLDIGFKLIGQKAMFVKVQSKLLQMLSAAYPFIGKTWNFKNDKLIAIDSYLVDEDIEAFGNKMGTLNIADYMEDMMKQTSKLAGEDISQFSKNYLKLKKIYYVHYIWNKSLIVLLGFYGYNNVLMPLFGRYCEYLTSL